MNPDRPSDRRAWWIISILVVAVAGSIASLAYLKNARANRRIEAERPILQKRTEDLRTRRDLRPVYFEPAAEGNGWPLLLKAVKGIAAVPQDELQAFPRLSNDEDAKLKPAEAEAVLIQIAPLLDDLKGALRCAWTEPDYDYENHVNMKSLNLGDVIKLSRVLAGAAVLRHDEGRYEESADLLILNLGLGDRVATKGNIIHVLVGIVVQNIAVSTLAQELLGQGRFDEPTLKRLQRVLDMAAKSRVSVLEAMRVEDLWQRHLAVDFATRGSAAIAGLGSPDALAGSWSIDGMSARYLETQDRFMTEIERLAWLPFPASQDGLKGLGKEIEK